MTRADEAQNKQCRDPGGQIREGFPEEVALVPADLVVLTSFPGTESPDGG